MLPFQIKICGVTSAKDALNVCQSRADAVGLNFYPQSSRYVEPGSAKEIANAVRDFDRGNNASPMKIVGVFVNMALGEIVEIAKSVGLDGIQLHGDEEPDCLSELWSLVQFGTELDLNAGIMRAIRTNPAGSDDNTTAGDFARVEAETQRWIAAGIDSVLLDAAVPGEFGGTGKVVDWIAIPNLKCSVPLILAGGLNPENVRNAIETAKVRSVDVASGVEVSPGVKDAEKVKRFAEEAAGLL